MFLDQQNLFSDAQAVTGASGTNVLSTNSIDQGVPGTMFNGGATVVDMGRSCVPIFAQVVEAFAGAGVTVQAQIITGTGVDGNGQINAGLVVLQETAAVALASLVPGYKFRISEVPHGATQRYLQTRYVIGGGTATAGKITAGLAMEVDNRAI